METPALPPSPAPPASPFTAPRRLHPLTLVQHVLKSLPAFALVLVPALLRSPGGERWLSFLVLFLYGAVMVPLILLQYARFRYWISADAIVIESGVVTRRKRSIPLDRIQNVEIERSLLPRLLGTAKVKIETAGSKGTEGVLEYVSAEDARRFRQVVRGYQGAVALPSAAPSAEASPGVRPQEAPLSPAEPARHLLFTMSFRRILLAGTFRFSLLYIALIFSGLQSLIDLTGMDPNDVVDWLLRGGLEPYAALAEASPWLMAVLTIVPAALLGWATGVLVNLSRYYGFRLWLQEGRLHKRHGLLTTSEGTIPLGKVQALLLRSNPLMRRFGWYRLELQTMGYDVAEQGHQVAVPFAREADILALAPHIRPFAIPEALTPVSRFAIRRTFVRYGAALAVVLLPLAAFWPRALWGFLALPALLYLAVLQYRHHGYALRDRVLYIRRGVFQHYLWIIPVEKLQVFELAGSLFQRRLGLRTLRLDTAGAGTFHAPRIVDAPAPAAEAFLDDLYAAFKERSKGADG